MVDAGSIWINLKLNADGLVQGIDKSKKSLVEWRDQTNASTGDLAKWGAAIGATVTPMIAAGYAVVALTQKYGLMAQELENLSYATNLSTDMIQRLQYAAVLSGTNFNTTSESLSKLSLAMADAENSTSLAGKAMAAIGVDVNGKTTDQVFNDISIALVGMEDLTTRNKIAMGLFGEQYRKILPLMEKYVTEYDKIKDHPIYDEKELQDLKDAKIAWDELTTTVTIYSGKVIAQALDGIELLGVMDEAYRKLGRGDLGGFLDAASEYRLQKIKEAYTFVDPTDQWVAPLDKLIDKYSDLSDEQYRLQLSLEEMNKAQEAYDIAKVGGDQAAFDVASKRLKQLQTDYENLGISVEETRDKQLGLRELTNVTIPNLTEKLKEARLTGLKSDIESASIALEKATNQANDLRKAIGAPSLSPDTYNTTFAASLDFGRVGPDIAGYSDLANMSIEQLREIAKGGLGKSKGVSEKAQTYIDRMAKEGITAQSPSAGSIQPGTKEQTAEIQPGTKEQTAEIQSQTELQATAYETRLNAFQDYGEMMLDMYVSQEQQDLTHWTAVTELVRISAENISENWKKYVTFAAEYPVIHNIGIVNWTKDGPDWVPQANAVFMQTLRIASLKSQELSFAAANFSEIDLSKKEEKKPPIFLTVNVDKTGNVSVSTEEQSQSLGKQILLGGT